MTTFYGVCQACSEAVQSPQTPAFRVQGFEVPRDQGGANHIRNRERIANLVWHEACLPSPRVNAEQETMQL